MNGIMMRMVTFSDLIPVVTGCFQALFNASGCIDSFLMIAQGLNMRLRGQSAVSTTNRAVY